MSVNPVTGLKRRKWSKHNLFVSSLPSYCQIEDEKTDTEPVFILVHLGLGFPWHIYECLQQLVCFGANRIVFVGSNAETLMWVAGWPQVEPYLFNDRDIVAKIEQVQPSGLFSYSIARFWAIHEVMTHLNLEQCFHMEHDNLVYAPLSYLWTKARLLYGEKLGVTRDAENRCIAGFMWIGSRLCLKEYMSFVEAMKYSQFEMMSLCAFLKEHPQHIDILPVVPEQYRTDPALDKFNNDWHGVFDAAALGQWVGGIDPIHSDHDTRGFVNETAVYSPEIMPVFWAVDSQQRLIPLIQYEQQFHRVFNLHIHSKMLHLYVSHWICPSEVIQGHRFRRLADYIFHTTEDLKRFVSPDLKKHKDNIVLVYVKADLVDTFFHEVWPQWHVRTVLITHNADFGIEDRHCVWLNDPKLVFWFAQNVNTIHSKLQEIPIGIANSEFEHGQVQTLVDIANKHLYGVRRCQIYANFSPTHPSRIRVQQQLERLPNSVVYQDLIRSNPATFWKKMTTFRAVCCPRGNGIDTHRLWETWYLGGVPIVCNQPDQWRPSFPDTTLPSLPLEMKKLGRNLPQTMYKAWKSSTGRREIRFSYWEAMIKRQMCTSFQKFDACIVVHPKDFEFLDEVVYGLQRHALGLRNVYVVTTTEGLLRLRNGWSPRINTSNVIVRSERDVEPCSFEEVQTFGFGSRTGWYYQQLLKLNLDTIEGLLEHFLIIDADTVLRRPVLFWDHNSVSLCHTIDKDEFYYRQHIEKLLPSLMPLKNDGHSAVVHHMPMLKTWLSDMKRLIETQHSGTSFHQSFLACVHEDYKFLSGASEYELYFQYAMHYHPKEITVRKLQHINTGDRKYLKSNLYDLVSVHSYLRQAIKAL